MAIKSQGTWYVPFQIPPGKRSFARATETFRSEFKAKKFCESEIGRDPKCQRGHAQSSSAETDHRPSADA
jgi:hypothetical protein